MSQRNFIRPEEAAELNRLFDALLAAIQRAAEALRTSDPLAMRKIDEQQGLAEILRRISLLLNDDSSV